MDKLNSWKTIDFDSKVDTLKSYLDKIIKKVLKNIEEKLNKKSNLLRRPATTGQFTTQKKKMPFRIGGRKTLKKKKRRRKRNHHKKK